MASDGFRQHPSGDPSLPEKLGATQTNGRSSQYLPTRPVPSSMGRRAWLRQVSVGKFRRSHTDQPHRPLLVKLHLPDSTESPLTPLLFPGPPFKTPRHLCTNQSSQRTSSPMAAGHCRVNSVPPTSASVQLCGSLTQDNVETENHTTGPSSCLSSECSWRPKAEAWDPPSLSQNPINTLNSEIKPVVPQLGLCHRPVSLAPQSSKGFYWGA